MPVLAQFGLVSELSVALTVIAAGTLLGETSQAFCGMPSPLPRPLPAATA